MVKITYNTASRTPTNKKSVIYIVGVDNSKGDLSYYDGKLKIGDTSLKNPESDLRPNSNDLRNLAKDRINEYMGTSGLPYVIEWAELGYSSHIKNNNGYFRDYDVHMVLNKSNIKKANGNGNEWYVVSLDNAKKAIRAIKMGHTSIADTSDKASIHLRKEQKEAVKKTKRIFNRKSNNKKVLWNAKMRFGKTLTALQLIKEQRYNKVLIITHRPVVNGSWFDDFNKIGMNNAYKDMHYIYGSKNKGERLEALNSSNNPFVYFSSIQDLGGSKIVKGKYDKNSLIFNINWDLIIIDEAHEGTQTDLSQRIINNTEKENTKILELSGTPFNLIDQYDEDQIFNWSYVDEQQSKQQWPQEHPDLPKHDNPYIGLPKLSMYTFKMGEKFSNRFNDIYDKSFNFKEFFRVQKNDEKHFVHEKDVYKFLDNITKRNDRTNYPFSTSDFRNNLKHTLWVLPGIKEAKALDVLMKKHPIFKHYDIINVVDNNDDIDKDSIDIDRVRNAIGNDPSKTKTITLTVRKLTTGVTVPEWTGIVFLSNTNSAMQYLQAAFRAQTPYSDYNGMKTNCYIFDFAPDRALKVMAETRNLSTGAGKLITKEERDSMEQLMNFLPIIGEEGHQMKPFNVNNLLNQVKRVYAEKAYNSGFYDNSIYSDELFKVTKEDLQKFKELRKKIGFTKRSSDDGGNIVINDQGLDDKEYSSAVEGQKKRLDERTDEEKEVIKKINAEKRNRRKLMATLRSISIRIPLMIYGLDIDINEDIDINTFVDSVDDKSWNEFMPNGVDKKVFKEFEKYYDSNVFIEAGKIIRAKVKELDNYDPIERTRQLALIFDKFHNPDKETVLTPWRVVNMHLGKTIGGLSFYDDHYKYTFSDGKDESHWLDTELTSRVFYNNTHILEINSKTGLYPLYVATSLYYLELYKLNSNNAGNFSYKDELMLWKLILQRNIFVVAKTKMAKYIAQRTIRGYNKYVNTNIVYIQELDNINKNNISKCVNKIEEQFNNMKFDAIVGNPPYQTEAKGNSNGTMPIYNLFMDLSYSLSNIVTLVTPGRFLFDAGRTPKHWNEKMFNDKHLKLIYYEQNSDKVFPKTDIKGGVAITLRDSNKQFNGIGKLYSPYKEANTIVKKVWKNSQIGLNNIVSSRGIFKFSKSFFDDHPNAKTILGIKNNSNVTIATNTFEKMPDVFLNLEPNDGNSYIKIFGRLNNERVYRYIKGKYVTDNNYTNAYKVIIPEANGNGIIGEALSGPFIGKPHTGTTDTYISIGSFKNKYNAINVLKYIKTKFARIMLGMKKVTQHNSKSKWALVPNLDFSNTSDIDWNQSITNINKQLYNKYNLNNNEIDFIENKAQSMN